MNCPDDKSGGNNNNNSNNNNNNRRFNGKCNWCGIHGHKEVDCRKKKAGVERANLASQNDEREVAFIGLDEFDFCMECNEEEDDYVEIEDDFAFIAAFNESDDDSMPSLVNRTTWYDDSSSDGDDSSDDDDDVPGLAVRAWREDDSSDDEDWSDSDESAEILWMSRGTDYRVDGVLEVQDVTDSSVCMTDIDEESETGREDWDVPDAFFDTFKQVEEEESFVGDDFGTIGAESDVALSEKPKGILKNGDGATEKRELFTANTWVADSGASCHMTNDDSDMFDVSAIDEHITIGDGKRLKATRKGKIRRMVRQKDGTTLKVTLEVKYVPDLWTNLFSLTKAMATGSKLGNDDLVIKVSKDGKTVKFDKIFKTKAGFICGVEICPTQEENQMAHLTLDKGQRVALRKLHGILGHVGEDCTRKTGKYYGWEVHGPRLRCEDCGVGKMKQASVSKEEVKRSTIVGERLFLDVSSIKHKSLGGSKFWLMVMDDASDHCWSIFLKKKSLVSKTTRELIKDIEKKLKIKVKFIRCDNAGENKKLQEDCLSDGMGIQFEFTAPGTPQQNGRIERKFATIYGRARAMMRHAGLSEKQRQLLWSETVSTGTDMENCVVTSSQEVPSYERFYKKPFKDARSLHTFGEMAIVRKIQHGSKLDDRGRVAMFLGYARDTAPGTYRFLILETKRIVVSRDYTWLGSLYGAYKRKENGGEPTVDDDDGGDDDDYLRNNPYYPLQDDDDDDDENNNLPDDVDDNDEADEAAALPEEPRYRTRSRGLPPTTQAPTDNNPRLERELRRIQWSDEPTPAPPVVETVDEEDNQTGREEQANSSFDGSHSPLFDRLFDEFVFFTNTSVAEYIEPKTFREAWDHPDLVQREKWREAIRKEFRDMLRRGVWRIIERNRMPSGRRCVKHKWVFKIKRDGRFRARLVACGYSQIPGVDYTENYSPVIHDVTYRLLLIIQIVFGLKARIIDVETAFLHGDLEEEIYMDCPEGMEGGSPDKCLLLQKTIYGLVQSARMFFKKCVRKLKDIGFETSKADPCLLFWNSDHGVVYIAIYVDDCYCVGTPKALDIVTELLQKQTASVEPFSVTVTDGTSDYLSCEVLFSKDKKKAWLGQPHLIKNLHKSFFDDVKNMPAYRTPGTPNVGLRRSPESAPEVSKEDHAKYRSGVGMLLYLVKHSRPDIANAVRELTKLMDKPTLAAVKEMKRCIKFVLDTAEWGLRIFPTGLDDDHWTMTIYTDSDWAGDKDSRLSVSGFILYLLGVPITWRSKQQRSVALSSSEAEYVSLSEAAKEIKFVYQIMMSMGLKVRTPIVVRVDNVGAIFMAENVSTSARTRHVDIRYAYVREFVEEGFLKILFVKTKENLSDGFTKNVSADIYEAHAPHHVIDKKEFVRTG